MLQEVVLEEVMLEQDAGELQTPCEQTVQNSISSRCARKDREPPDVEKREDAGTGFTKKL